MTTAELVGTGIVWGQEDAQGVYWSLQSGSRLFGPSPAPREVSGERAVAHGTWSGTEFYGPRSWSPELIVRAPSHEALHDAEERLTAALPLSPTLFVGTEPHFGARRIAFRRAGQILWNEMTPTIAQVSLQLQADDPLLRGTDLTASTGAPSSSGGLSWPTSWPASWDAVVVSGQLSLPNAGGMASDVLWRIDGPITHPYVIDIPTGRTLRTTLTLAGGEFVTIDTATHRVLAQGDAAASRRDRLYGTWFQVPAGGTRVQFGGESPGASAQVTATWAPTWI